MAHKSLRLQHRWTLLLLTLITALGGTLRLIGLPQKGLAFYDEGVLHQEALFTSYLIRFLAQSIWLKVSDTLHGTDFWTCGEQTNLLLDQYAGIPPYDAKPLHWGIVALAIAVFGNADFAGPTSMAIFGILTIPLIFLIGKKLFGTPAGLLAAFLLALNPFHLAYSRQGFAESDSVFFFSLSIYLLLCSFETKQWKWLAGGSAVAGISALANHRYLILGYGIFFSLYAILGLTKKYSFKSLLKGLLLATCSYTGIFLVSELPWYILVLLFKRCGEVLPFETYFEQLLHLYSAQFIPVGFRTEGIFSIFSILWILAGPFHTVLTVTAFLWIIAERKFASGLVVIVWFTLPLIWFSLYALKLSRYLSLVIPAGCLAAAFALASCFNLLSKRMGTFSRRPLIVMLAWIGVVMVGLGSLPQILGILRQASGYPQAFYLLQSTGAPKHFSTQYFLSATYLGKENSRMMPVSIDELRQAYQEGYHYYLVDLQVYFDGYDRWAERLQVLQQITYSTQPRWIVANPIGATPQYPLEHNFDWAETQIMLRALGETGLLTEIRIYDLRDYFGLDKGPSP